LLRAREGLAIKGGVKVSNKGISALKIVKGLEVIIKLARGLIIIAIIIDK
jgi:hypothetical protein